MDSVKVFENLVHLATQNGITVKFVPLRAHYAMLYGDCIGIRQNLGTIDDFNYNLAHELAHYFLHYDKGNTITSEKHVEYEEQADRAAKMLLAALSVGGAA